MHYHDFDLYVGRGPDGTVSLRSHCAVHGDYPDVTTIDAAARANDDALLAQERIDHATLIEIGTRLHSYLFAAKDGSINWAFGQCWGSQTQLGQPPGGVRVRLFVEAPELAAIPWEYLYSPRLRGFLGTSERTPIVRFLPLPQGVALLEAPLPIRMLVAIPGRSKAETDELVATLTPFSETVQLTVLDGEVTLDRITDALGTAEYHLFHFIGHGDFDGERAVLLFNRAGGGEELVDQERMANLFRNHSSMKLVVLNSCRGGEQSESKQDVGMAAALVKVGVPAVIAMQYEIHDAEAICFSRAFYRSLFVSPDKGRIEIAISKARNALVDEFRDSNAVGLPVLFTHAQEGVLFDFVRGNRFRDMPFWPRAVHAIKATIRSYQGYLEADSAHAPDTDPERKDTADKVRAALGRAQQRLRLRNVVVTLLLGVAVLLCLGVSFFGFQRLHPLFRPESYFVALNDIIGDHHDGPSVLLVAIDSTTTRALHVPGDSTDEPDSTWRGRDAHVLDRLTRAHARVVAFNLRFVDRPSAGMRAVNDSLAKAFEAARAAGVKVLVPVNRFVNGTPNIAPAFLPNVAWGVNCADNIPALSSRALRVAIGSAAPSADANAIPGKPHRVPSLPLAAVAAFNGTPFNDAAAVRAALPPTATGVSPSAVLLDSMVVDRDDESCAVTRGDTVYRMLVDLTRRSELRDHAHRISYLDVLQDRDIGDLRDRLVLVGYENPDTLNTFSIQRGWSRETRYRVEIEADAINTLLHGVRIAPLATPWQFVVILAMAILGALCAERVARVGRVALFALPVALAAYFAFGMALYAARHLLLNTIFDLLSLFITFLVVWFVHKRWFP